MQSSRIGAVLHEVVVGRCVGLVGAVWTAIVVWECVDAVSAVLPRSIYKTFSIIKWFLR